LENSQLFDLIDASYKEDLSNQPQEYKKDLFKSAQRLLNGTDEIDVCVEIYKNYHDNFIAPMSLPTANRTLYSYIKGKLKTMDRKRLRDLNLGYGLIATHITFGSLN